MRKTFDVILLRYRAAGLTGCVKWFAHALRVRADRAALQVLRLIFGFERWHAASPDSARPYRQQLITLVSELAPERAAEVGCGLGSIIAHVNAAERLGLDTDPSVIRAARFLHRHGVRFAVGSFEDLPSTRMDIVIAVNWLHQFAPQQAKRWIAPLLPRVRYLLIDTIKPGTPGGYACFHDFAFLRQHADCMKIPAAGEPHRTFLLWKVRAASRKPRKEEPGCVE